MGVPPGGLLEVPRFRRLLVWSVVAHAGLAFLLAYAPSGAIRLDQPPPVFVDLVSLPKAAGGPAAPAAKPAAKPEPKAVPIPKEAPPKPKAKEAPKPEPKKEAKVPPKPRARVEPKPKPKPATQARATPAPPAVSAEQLISEMRKRVDAQSEAAPAAAAVGDGGSNGPAGGRYDPELAGYRKQLVVLLQSNWVGARAFRSQGALQVRYEIEVDDAGTVQSVELVASSGNRHFDETAERAIWKTNPFPRPPRGALTVDLSFEPRGVF
jgi:TonB family protein